MSRVSVMRLAEELRPYIEGKDTIMRTSIDVLKQGVIPFIIRTSPPPPPRMDDLIPTGRFFIMLIPRGHFFMLCVEILWVIS